MDKKTEKPPKEDELLKKCPAWVFDERMGWIDVNEFLSKTANLSEELARKIKKPS